MSERPTVIITGSSGLVGSGLVSYLAGRGFHVRAFQRAKPSHPVIGVTYYPFDLIDVRDEGFAGADYLIHCAYRPIISRHDREHGVNVDLIGTKRIIELSRAYGIKMIFLSSLSAHQGALTFYAQNKLAAEGLFDPQRDLILRLGIVLGGRGGLFGRIMASLRGHAIVPLIGGRQHAQTVALDDLCSVIETAINRNIAGIYAIAHPSIITMEDLYRGIASAGGVRPIFIPVPLNLAYRAAWLLEEAGIKLPFTSQSILGIRDLQTTDTRRDLAVFGVHLKDCKTTLSRLHLHNES